MMVAFAITEINYLTVSPFFDLVRPLSYLYLQCQVLYIYFCSAAYAVCYYTMSNCDAEMGTLTR